MTHFKITFTIALLTVIGGVFIAGLFGISEELFKDKIARGLKNNEAILSIENPTERAEVIAAEQSKNWRYYQRFHFHATGIGVISIAALMVLFIADTRKKIVNISAYAISIGGFLYPFFWLFAAVYGPEIGRGAAKSRFEFFAYSGAVFLVGLVLTVIIVWKYGFHKFQKSEKP